jgi:transcriptional repressor NrdR
MQCPFCQAQDTKVIDSRLVGDKGDQVRRRRECILCSERFTTYESIELSFPRLVKRDGSCVQFREEKLRGGILRSLEKRPVRTEQVDAAVNRLLNRLRESGEREIETKVVGEWVMAELRALDEVAYVRFASVYRRFQDVDEFKAEIARLRNDTAEIEKIENSECTENHE